MGQFILDDLSRNPVTGVTKINFQKALPLDRAWCLTPFEAHVRINFTGPVGSCSGIYYSLVFQLGKWEYTRHKAGEFLEVSPIHGQYYQLSHKQREELEARIKSGLTSASQSVADLELLMHDLRKYKEFLHYMGYRTRKESNPKYAGDDDDEIDFSVDADEKKRKEREKRVDSHSLKAVFIDQVDMHTGEGISMRSIVSRWPTLITDFMRMQDKELKPDDIMKELDVSKAEAVVLVTKNKLYQEWKKMFLAQLRDRYTRISELVRSRKKSVETYRDWLKPAIARHDLLTEALDTPEGRATFKTHSIWNIGHAQSFSILTLWAWKDFFSPELMKGGAEDYGKRPVLPSGKGPKQITIDKWTIDNLLFGKNGLVQKYPWLTLEWCQEKLNAFHEPTGMYAGWLTRKPYYSFFEIMMEKGNVKLPTGEELEDAVFDVNLVVMSKNVLFVKLLDLVGKQEKLNMYVDNLLGIAHRVPGKAPQLLGKGRFGSVSNITKFFNFPFEFAKGHGPYERDFNDRITKYYLAPIAGDRYGPITGFIKKKAGFGVR